ncbi:MAG TPA: hypothetical protein PKH39_05565 [Woeseiaceae bacterium]|nr:hypothetical protein [Woeseiaceae bacterium]
MWLPTKLYERLPLWWIVVGLVFMLSALYLGLDYGAAYGYLALGVACSVFGLLITLWRVNHRNSNATDNQSSPDDTAAN